MIRIVYLEYEYETTALDIHGYRFGMPAVQFASSKDHEYNKCYCVKPTQEWEGFDADGCLPAGVVNLVNCQRERVPARKF